MISEYKMEEPLVSYSHKYPKIFRWRSMALFVAALIGLMVIADVILYFYLRDHPVPNSNTTFGSGLVWADSDFLQKSSEFKNLLGNMYRINPSISFQTAEQLMVIENNRSIRLENITQNIFRVRDHNLLYLMEVVNNASERSKFGLYVPAAFPIPKEEDRNPRIPYYTFETPDNRFSTLFSLKQDGIFLISNATNKQRQLNPLLCPTYVLSQKFLFFQILGIFAISLDESNSIFMSDNVKYEICCFHGFGDLGKLQRQIERILGINLYEGNARIDRMEVYYLEE